MGQQWENPSYGKYRRRHALLALVLLLAVIVAAAFLLPRRTASDNLALPAAKEAPNSSPDVSPAIPSGTEKPTAEIADNVGPGSPVMDVGAGQQSNELQRAADELFTAGKFAEALGAYNRLVPSDPFSRSRAGICLSRLGRWNEAIAEVQAALNAQPDDFAARKWLPLAPSCPLWLQEGLAQYVCGYRPVSAGQVIPLPLLANGFPAEPHAAYAAYMESLQVVVDLVEEYGMSRLRGFLDKLSNGSDLETGFAALYGQPFSRWAAHWRPLQSDK